MPLLDRLGLTGPRIKFWFAFVAVFYAVWFMLVFGFGNWDQVRAHWPMFAVMTFGSIVAGSTPMGGGTVAFPFLVLVFGQPPSLGRNFGLAIQAVGMTSALVYIYCRAVNVQWRLLGWTSVGSAAGLLAGTFWVAPHAAGAAVKLLFSCLWMSFAVLTLARNREMCSFQSNPEIPPPAARALGLSIGLAGGVIAALIGVGVEMLLYASLVLLYRTDLKIAVPTAVSAMAVASILGAGLHLAIGDIGREVFYNWLAAGPVVVFGAPFGAFLVSVIPRVRTLYFVSALCVIQFIWTLYQVRPSPAEWAFVAVSITAAVAGFHGLYRAGRRRELNLRAALASSR